MPFVHDRPRLPVELHETIISFVWFSPLTSEQRITFMTSSMLVNKGWMSMFLSVSLQHVYFPIMPYLDAYLSILASPSPSLKLQSKSRPGLLCRSINVTIDRGPVMNCGSSPVMERVLSNLLYFLRILKATPRLRILSIDYLHGSFDDIFDFLSYNPLPKTLTRLELMYTSCCNEHSELDLPNSRRLAQVAFTLPNIRHLTICGGSKNMIASLVLMCPKLRTLQIHRSQLEGQFANTVATSAEGDAVLKYVGSSLQILHDRGFWKGSLVSVDNDIVTFCRSEG